MRSRCAASGSMIGRSSKPAPSASGVQFFHHHPVGDVKHTEPPDRIGSGALLRRERRHHAVQERQRQRAPKPRSTVRRAIAFLVMIISVSLKKDSRSERLATNPIAYPSLNLPCPGVNLIVTTPHMTRDGRDASRSPSGQRQRHEFGGMIGRADRCNDVLPAWNM